MVIHPLFFCARNLKRKMVATRSSTNAKKTSPRQEAHLAKMREAAAFAEVAAEDTAPTELLATDAVRLALSKEMTRRTKRRGIDASGAAALSETTTPPVRRYSSPAVLWRGRVPGPGRANASAAMAAVSVKSSSATSSVSSGLSFVSTRAHSSASTRIASTASTLGVSTVLLSSAGAAAAAATRPESVAAVRSVATRAPVGDVALASVALMAPAGGTSAAAKRKVWIFGVASRMAWWSGTSCSSRGTVPFAAACSNLAPNLSACRAMSEGASSHTPLPSGAMTPGVMNLRMRYTPKTAVRRSSSNCAASACICS